MNLKKSTSTPKKSTSTKHPTLPDENFSQPSSGNSQMCLSKSADPNHSMIISGCGFAIPTRLSARALVWASVKIGKSERKEFHIQNTTSVRVNVFVTVDAKDPYFELLDDGKPTSSMGFSLDGWTDKTLSAGFSPASQKAAAGSLLFSNCCQVCCTEKPCFRIKLLGYGGFCEVKIPEAIIDFNTDRMKVSLAEVSCDCCERLYSARIRVHNHGDLCCFANIRLQPQFLYLSVTSSWSVKPDEVLLLPNQTQWVTVDFVRLILI